MPKFNFLKYKRNAQKTEQLTLSQCKKRPIKRKRRRPLESKSSTPSTSSTPLPDYIPLEGSPQRNPAPVQPQVIYSPLKPLTLGPRSPPKPYEQSHPPLPEQPMDYLDLSLSSSSPESPPIDELQDFTSSEHINYCSTCDSSTNSTPLPRGTWRNIRQHSVTTTQLHPDYISQN